MPTNDTIESLKRIREELLDMASAATNVNYEDGLRAAAQLITFEIDFEIGVEMIDKMTPEEIKESLFARGYTEEMLDISYQRFREAINKHVKTQTNINKIQSS